CHGGGPRALPGCGDERLSEQAGHLADAAGKAHAVAAAPGRHFINEGAHPARRLPPGYPLVWHLMAALSFRNRTAALIVPPQKNLRRGSCGSRGDNYRGYPDSWSRVVGAENLSPPAYRVGTPLQQTFGLQLLVTQSIVTRG